MTRIQATLLLSLLLGFFHISTEAKSVFKMICFDPWFSFIKDGIKSVEGRKNSPTYSSLEVGDLIEFINGDEHFTARVVELRTYATLEEYLLDVTYQKAVPGVTSLEEAINIYLQWSAQEEIERYGFLGIFIALESPAHENNGSSCHNPS